jgi:formate hydrogenlyase subunit 7
MSPGLPVLGHFPRPIVPDRGESAQKMRKLLEEDIKRSVHVFRVDTGGCNACELEIFASTCPIWDAERIGVRLAASPRHADILLVTGAMTRSMREPALRAYNAVPDPKIVMAYGACGCSGGIFHDYYATWGGAPALFPVDVFVPGCPPTPAGTVYAFALALGLLAQKVAGKHHVEAEGEQAPLKHPKVAKELRVAVEREARRMSGYLQGGQIADDFLGLLGDDGPAGAGLRLGRFLAERKDPRLAEVMNRLFALYVAPAARAGATTAALAQAASVPRLNPGSIRDPRILEIMRQLEEAAPVAAPPGPDGRAQA